jgi:ribosomal protein L16 Arg81 hydroxylase
MQAPSLQEVLGPLDVGEFLATHWRKRSYFRCGATAARDHVESVLGGLSAEHLANRSVRCDVVGQVDGLDRRNDLPAAEALVFYSRGYTLYLNLLRAIPECRQLVETIVQDAGLAPPLNMCCAAFVSKSGRGVQPHLDVNENFTIQLSGRKVWTLWAEHSVPNTIHNAVLGESRSDPVAGMYMGPTPTAEELGPGEQVVMEPGCVLYHPSGLWHTTRAETESVSLNLSISPLTYYHVLIGMTEARLAASDALRRDLPPHRSATDVQDFTRGLTAAIEAAKLAVQDIDPTDALVPLARSRDVPTSIAALAASCTGEITPATRLRRNGLVALNVERKGQAARLRATIFLGRLTKHMEIAIPDDLEAACRTASSVRGEFEPKSFVRQAVSLESVAVVCKALESIGAFRRV